MSIDELTSKVEKAVQATGYPLEQRAGNLLAQNGWHVFHSVLYIDPSTEKQRELDIFAYKMINERRVELKIACKRSISKPWVFFTEDARKFLKIPGLLKVKPVSDDMNRYFRIIAALSELPFFSHDRMVINYSSFTGKELNNEARTFIREALYSVISSVYDQWFPGDLLLDQRGTITFYVVIYDGLLFEAFYDPILDKDIVKEINYAQWHTQYQFKHNLTTIPSPEGKLIPLSRVFYYFCNWMQVEVVKWSYLSKYLNDIETAFTNLQTNELELFGLPWTPENFPTQVVNRPTFAYASQKPKKAAKKTAKKGRFSGKRSK